VNRGTVISEHKGQGLGERIQNIDRKNRWKKYKEKIAIITLLNNYNKDDIILEMKKIGVDPYGIEIMSLKANSFVIKIDNVINIAANILKQQMLSLGGDAAVAKDTLLFPKKITSVLLIGNESIFLELVLKLKQQQFGLNEISEEILGKIKNSFKKFDLEKKHLIMGILNVTPDSFSDGGEYFLKENAQTRVKEMIVQGADIIDIGAESTKPGSLYITEEEEWYRLAPVIQEISKIKNIVFSIDTNKSEIARKCLELGANIVNDVSGLKKDLKMASVVADFDAKVIIMHSIENPATMQKDPCYKDLILEIKIFFEQQIDFALKNKIKENNIFLDPGIGFGKTLEHNLTLLNRLDSFKDLGFPIVFGASRKSFIGEILNKEVPDRLSGSLVSAVIAMENGANILRVHDVKETYDAVKIFESVKNV